MTHERIAMHRWPGLSQDVGDPQAQTEATRSRRWPRCCGSAGCGITSVNSRGCGSGDRFKMEVIDAFYGTYFEQQDDVLGMLRRAREIIRERGWNRGSRHGEDGSLCIYGAMREAGAWRKWTDLGLPWPALWQDEPGRTVDDVYDWFDREIALRESGR